MSNIFLFLFITATQAQLLTDKSTFTKEDSLRGSLNENRNWWNVLRYNITVKPDFEKKEIEGKVVLSAVAVKKGKIMQLDLQQPLIVDSIIRKGNFFTIKNGVRISYPIHQTYQFTQKDDIVLVELNETKRKGDRIDFHIYYHGKPKEAKMPPWDGGWIWEKDNNGNPFVSVAVQGLGASAWLPCKDHQSDEPDNGASLTIIVPDTLIAVSNGVLNSVKQISNSQFHSYTWQVKNPINNYCIIPYIGKYTNFSDTLHGEKGILNINYWVLDYNVEKAKEQFKQVKPMLRAFEYWFGAYPFYEDGYKIVEAPHLGMEHQSAIAYGNQYNNGYLGKDRSGETGWGLKWDFIIVHESGHEWFGNNITAKDVADIWVHEAFTTYSETLFTEYYYGKQAANEYNYGQRKNILNDKPIIGPYDVNKEGSSDMYDKGSNMINSIRLAINDDKKFRNILRGLNKTFYHKTVTTKEIEDYIIKQAGFNFQKVFDQYLRTTQIPMLTYKISDDGKQMILQYQNCVQGFNLPLWLNSNTLKIVFDENSKSQTIAFNENTIAEIMNLEKLYYIQVKHIK
ncbi:MAG: M1 family metallopeptidase [Chitinophagaceae bacterium]|nr:M1 family metallopeptidase [Chitinophagaceae bacterium]MCW5905949.1 M1 family metallopeptidase [Chitinophagaceae bacterium]